LLPSSGFASDDFPKQRPIAFIVGFGPGGSTDQVARLLAPRLKDQLGQTVVVDNKPGASGMLAAEALVHAPADGYTIMACTSSILTTHKYLFKNLRFDAADILPLRQIALMPYILLANPNIQAKTVSELVALAKSKPEKLTYGSAGVGSAGHLAAAMFSSIAGVRMTHVPYKGSGQAMADLVAGHINVAFDQEPTVSGFLSNGRLRALAIAGAERSPNFPQLPTLAEAGVAFEAASWTGVCMRTGTPQAIVDKVGAAVSKVMNEPEIKARFIQLGMLPRNVPSNEFKKLVESEGERMGRAITSMGITSE
jgi:tripartite-type tricarboxylate transporter receptor subunit TctC